MEYMTKIRERIREDIMREVDERRKVQDEALQARLKRMDTLMDRLQMLITKMEGKRNDKGNA